jgi:predicted ATP-grasp superfamily ATP-dependent carboligase
MVTVPDSGGNPGAFLNRLRDEVDRLQVRVVIPGTEQDLIAIASSAEPLIAATAGMPPIDVVLQITDKTVVYRVAEELGFQIPHTQVLDGEHLPDDVEFPLIVKPARSARAAEGGALTRTDAQLITSRSHLRQLVDGLGSGPWLAQSRVNGQLGAIGGVAHNGRLVTAVHQLSRRVWPPGAGVSAFAETVPVDRTLEAKVACLIDRLSWSGIFQAQFIHGDSGPHLIDVNPRLYGSLALATAAGVNLPAIWTALVTGSAVEAPVYQVGVRYRSEELDVRALAHVALHGRPLAAVAGLLPHRHTTHSVITLADPAPGLTSLGKLVRYVRRDLA